VTARQYLKTARNSVRSIRSNRFVPAGHFYSPIPSQGDVERAMVAAGPPGPDLDLRVADQLALAAELAPHAADVDRGPRYQVGNSQYAWADAAVYRAMLTRFRPGRVVEVGSGHSSALALDTCESEGLDTTFTFVDPYPERLLALLSDSDKRRVRIRDVPVQDVENDVFDQLGSGDILFIDSTHVAKAGSDVNHLFFTVLPRVAPGVWIHVHDIPWPFEYSRAWFAEGRAWNEVYLLRAFLSFNSAFRVELFSDYLAQRHPAEFAPFTSPRGAGQGSIWLRRVPA
jgi:hypothetical protein